MRFSRGFFRLWVFCSALFAIFVIYSNYQALNREWDYLSGRAVVMVPLLCGATGDQKVHAFVIEGQRLADGSLIDPNNPNPFATCLLPIEHFRIIHPEMKQLSDRQLMVEAHKGLNMEFNENAVSSLFETIANIAALALGVPLIVMVFGVASAWVLSGFKNEKHISE
ncbi:hypothetical protein LJR231_002059 [Phyllobacterium sp. LjRoot231]|uniref:hypothetical protein n=1 Tax=Phyllobacterium sp. LjRoot231 TaxID=3342289 RepID=UPI003ED14210